MQIKITPGYAYPESIRQLFTEYTDLLIAEDPQFCGYLKLQNFDEEIAHLETKYGLPEGRLYLAFVDGKPAGCIALRKLDSRRCEMKRLYVRPAFRGLGIGKRLTQQILEDARNIGYQQILLDTFPFLYQAIAMYQQMGFQEISIYNNCPVENTIYMAMEL